MSLGLKKTCILLYIINTAVSRVSLDSATLCNCGSQTWVSTSHGGGLVKAQPAGPTSSIFITSSQVVVLLLAWAHTWWISAPESSSFEIPSPPGCSITMLHNNGRRCRKVRKIMKCSKQEFCNTKCAQFEGWSLSLRLILLSLTL